MRLDREGRFKARPVEVGVNRGRDGEGTLCATIRWSIVSMLEGGEFVEHEDWNPEIIGYVYLERKDGTKNDSGWEQLTTALGWDGDLVALQESDWSSCVAQISVAEEEYRGKVSLKVGWIDAEDAQGGGGVKAAR